MLLHAVYLFLVFLFRGVLRVFFRRIEVVGAPPMSTARRMFGANHVNGVIDPALVLTSTWCRISPLAKAPLWKVPGLNLLLRAARAVPVVRRQDAPDKADGANDELFRAVGDHLIEGGNVLIFPEGVSHSEPHVVRLRSGAARMLVGARAQGVAGSTFQAVGLEFEERETFRSRALVLFGPVRSVDEMAARGGEGDLAERITAQLSDDLTELIVEGATWDERRLIGRVATLLAHDARDRSLAGWNSIGRQVEAARKAMGAGSHSLYAEVEEAVNLYDEGLSAAALTDEQLLAERADEGPRALRQLGLVCLLPLALVGALLYFVPYQIPKLSARLAKGEGDVISTYKLGLALVVFPAWMLLLVVVALAVVPWPTSLVAVAVVLGSPLATLPWLDWLDATQHARDVDRAGPVPSQEELLRRRAAALDAIGRARHALGI